MDHFYIIQEKTTRPNHLAGEITIQQFEADVLLDPVHHLKTYLERVRDIRTSESLWVTINKPHGGASKGTLASWLNKVISSSEQSGSAGSTRSTSSSQAANRGVNMEEILKAGDWAHVSPFRTFYWRIETLTFQVAVLA